MITTKKLIVQENKLFFRRWLKKPGQLGTLAPISCSFAEKASALLGDDRINEKIVVEIGAGTGRLSRALLEQGVRPDHFYAVELDAELCDFLKNSLPQGSQAIQGDACHLSTVLPQEIVGKVDVVYSVIPLMYLPQEVRDEIYQAVQKVLKPDGVFYHVCYSPISPYASNKAIRSERVISKWINLPSGFVWTFQNAL